MSIKDLMEEIKKAIVFLGTINKDKKNNENPISFLATGFLVEIKNIFHLVTAKHVITGEFINENLVFFTNLKSGIITFHSIKSLKNELEVDWIFHENKNVDIAIIPITLDPEVEDVKPIPDKLFIGTEKLYELYDVFFLSYQPGIEIPKKIIPIIRTGTISLLNIDKTFYIDGFTFPGNSGSPVFLKPTPIRFEAPLRISFGPDPLGGKFIGIISEYIPYKEVAISLQTNRPRVIFEENTGLSKVWSSNFIKEIIDSDRFKEQLMKIKNKKKIR